MRLIIAFCCFFLVHLLPAQNNSLLWEISGNGLPQPSYLYGTIHLRDARVFQFGDSVLGSFSRCKAVAGEIVMDKNIPSLGMLKMIMMPKDTTLKMLISKSDYDLVKKKSEEKLGNKAFMIDQIKPLFTSILFTTDDVKSDSTVSVDEYFQERANKRKMKVIGIESVQEQMEAINKISLKKQAEMLVESLKEDGKEDDASEEMIRDYLTQDIEKLEQLFRQDKSYEMFAQTLLLERNHIMADRIVPIIQKQPTFVAIGAGHLGGKEGVVSLLKEKGYHLRPIFFTFAPVKEVSREPRQDESGWYVFDSEDKKYEVHFPEKFSLQSSNNEKTLIASQSGNLFSLVEEDPEGQKAEKYFDNKVKELKEAGITVVSVKQSKADKKMPVLLVEGSESGIALIFQYYYLSKTKVVELAVTGSYEGIKSDTAKKFLSSLRLH